MNPFFIFSLIFFAVVVIFLAVARKEAKKHGTTTAGEFAGICATAFERSSKKEVRKQKALAILRERKEASNADIRGALGVSARTVVTYMDELEREGKAEQVGDVGQGVVYRFKED